jgi:hypothetical protein
MGVDALLAALADAARRNAKSEFDRLEHELLTHFHGGFEGMPEDVYQRYLDVDRHWPISLSSRAASDTDTPRHRRTLLVRLTEAADTWVRELSAATDRGPSAVVAECIEAVRADPALAEVVRARLERERDGEED